MINPSSLTYSTVPVSINSCICLSSSETTWIAMESALGGSLTARNVPWPRRGSASISLFRCIWGNVGRNPGTLEATSPAASRCYSCSCSAACLIDNTRRLIRAGSQNSTMRTKPPQPRPFLVSPVSLPVLPRLGRVIMGSSAATRFKVSGHLTAQRPQVQNHACGLWGRTAAIQAITS